ncbi:MAG TPA: hypothetical protein VFQ53_23915 [Kofleriaceae bacterium]|nr:hypothetical protein [Kofleriaceae bacterium]
MTAIDLPPGIGLAGTPLGVFVAPRRARRLALVATIVVPVLGALTWYFVIQHPWRRGASTQLVLPVALLLFALLGLAVRAARISITRDGVRWGWTTLGFHQQASRIVRAHVYRDGIALEARRGSWWFLAARDWDRFDVLVRQLRRAELPIADHPTTAPWRARLQSYGRFLDAMLVLSMLGSLAIMLWAS